MKYTLPAAVFCLLFASFAFAQTNEINIIPKPRSIIRDKGNFSLGRNTKIVATDAASEKMAGLLNEFLAQNYGFKLKLARKRNGNENAIIFRHWEEPPIGKEQYVLTVEEKDVLISGSEKGMFYSLKSLFQLLPADRKAEMTLPAVTIEDFARFPYRGMHLDVSRHFFSVEFVKKFIDLMSQYKFNTFHWHLTDDQGWRIEIKKYPRLTEIGSRRPESVKERNLNPYIGDGVPVEGFYTQEQIRDVVAYAKARYINVIPEIEIPGHSSAALAAYPELSCKADSAYKVQTRWGIFKEVYCPTEKTFQFLEDVLSETIALFPDSPYIHIGGDEVLKDMWKESPEVKELMASENLKDVNEVQSYFVRRMEKFINSKGKKIIGWDEILDGGLAPNATVMSWRGVKGGIEAAKSHHDVIMTPSDYVYFDYGQGDPAYEPLNIGSYVPLEKVYNFDPVPKELTPDEAKYIIGGQANIWTEYIPNEKQLEYMAFPRMIALSEVLWSPPENKNFADFQRRLAANLPRLDKQNVNYRIPEPAGLQNAVVRADGKMTVELTPAAGTKVYYTLDGSTPDERSAVYGTPITISLEEKERKDLKTIVVTPTGRKSRVYAATFIRRDYMPAGAEIKDKRGGVTYGLAFLRPGATEPSVVSGEARSLALQQFAKTADLKQKFAVTFDGWLNVSADGIYEFQAESTWDTAMYMDGEALFNTIGSDLRAVSSAVVPLRAGLHKVSFCYTNRGGDPFYRVRFGLKGQGLRNLGGGELVH
jgi:hexosaminidase